LNLLRSSWLHPQLSAAAHYHALIDYNKTVFAPPGCNIIAREKPAQRPKWAPHGRPGWYLGSAMNHNTSMPQMSSTDIILMAAQDMTDALKHPHPDEQR
jgi:hypothetical protein